MCYLDFGDKFENFFHILLHNDNNVNLFIYLFKKKKVFTGHTH